MDTLIPMTPIKNSLIKQIDKIILLVKNNKTPFLVAEKRELLKKFTAVILKERNIEFDTDEIDPLFNGEISIFNKGIIAIYLLRLWSADENIFEGIKDFQRKTIRLIDEVIEHDRNRLKELNVKPGDQTFEKINKIKDFVHFQDEKIESIATYDIDHIDGITAFKNHLLSTLRNNAIKQLVSPFLPKDINAKIDATFILVKTYINSSSETKSTAFENVESCMLKLINEAKEWDTVYSDFVIVRSFSRVVNVIRNDFANSPFSKPADLNITLSNKKYPFSQIDYEFRIALIIANEGLGHAYNVKLELLDISIDAIVDRSKELGTIGLDRSVIEFNCKMLKAAKDGILDLQISWTNFDKSQSSKKLDIILDGQRDDINWEQLKLKDFYSIEAVDTEDELIGRREILNYLMSRTDGKKIGSAYIYGQRRVGKSSIVKTLKTKLEKLYPNDIIVFYQETGEYKDPNPNRTIDQLSKNICNKIKGFDKRITHVEQPEFHGALSPLAGYLDQITAILPNCKILIILDEFDKIPVEMYRKGEIGDSFFDTIRAISNKGPYGFLLVGGERMEYIMRDQSQEVNKFKSIRVDYFDKKNNWTDFTDLVIRPIEDYFEITDEAIGFLYEQTAGNPFFTKVICEELITLMVNHRDNYITLAEAKEATQIVINSSGEQTFAHFWKDGIRDILVSEEEVTSNRRKILIALVSVIKNGLVPSTDNIIDIAVREGLQEVTASSTLKEFIDRDILIDTNHIISFKVALFKLWLINGGVEKLKTTLVESDRLDQEKLQKELAKVKSQEIVDLLADWKTYRGQEITTDKVRVWLEQFGDNRKQRLMFKLLQNLHFYNDFEIKIKMGELFQLIRRSFIEAGSVRTIVGKEFKRKDILVSYLEDSPAKSGAEYAKIFADENKIFHKNVMAPDKLERFIANNNDVHSVVFIDDFLGTGNSAMDNINRLVETYPKLFAGDTVQFYLGIVCGFQEAKQKTLNKLKRQKINITIHLCDILSESDKVFEDSSKVYTSPGERHMARTVCYSFGSTLVKNSALGYGNAQAIVVFPNTIPNNSLPVLWVETKNWKPLFLRPI